MSQATYYLINFGRTFSRLCALSNIFNYKLFTNRRSDPSVTFNYDVFCGHSEL